MTPCHSTQSTKHSDELMADNYSVRFELPTTGLRFFTVCRACRWPYLALFLFARNILEGKEWCAHLRRPVGASQRRFYASRPLPSHGTVTSVFAESVVNRIDDSYRG